MTKKRLTEKQFFDTISKLNISDQTKEISFGVLVKGEKQILYAKKFDISKGAVSLAVKKVFETFKKENLPEGFEKVTAILPKHKAYTVKRWAEQALAQLSKEERFSR